VILGRVRISTTADDGSQTIGRIVRTQGLFGECSLIDSVARSESAVALDAATLMSWSRDEIEEHVEREPRLGIALAQYLVRECVELQDRIESMAIQKTPERVTHLIIAEFAGTSRPIVTYQMNRLRRLGPVRYSRKHIEVHAEAMRENLRQTRSPLDGGS
jgi:CRP-like cAMP-binding protein